MPPDNTISLPTWTCIRCGHTWIPRITEKPRNCAKCRSPYWDKPRQRTRPATREQQART